MLRLGKIATFLVGFLMITSSVFAQTQPQITESSLPSEDIYIDDIVQRKLVTESEVLPYESLREADVPYSKKVWRLIDTREKLNLVWRAEKAPFFNILKELSINGEITVFEDEFFKEPLTAAQVDAKMYKIDTNSVLDEVTYTTKLEVVKNTKDWRNINKYRVKEVWFFDKQYSVFKCRILAIAPLLDERIEELDQTVQIPLFWVYFPEARQHLAKHRVLNDLNDAAPMSWADLLDNRFFSSYIFKRSNILDYRLQDKYDSKIPTADFDILLESEKIKQELFNFEHDLWEY
jgi:gliding motility associated protien GldN